MNKSEKVNNTVELKQKMSGAVHKLTPDNQISGRLKNTNHREHYTMDLNLKELALPQDFQNMPGAKKTVDEDSCS